MQVPIVSGIYTKAAPDIAVSYPINLQPIAEDSGVSKGYLRTALGVETVAQGQGPDRGGQVWNGRHYRVSGTKLIDVAQDGTISVIGDVGTGGPVSFAYSFDRLAIASSGRLFYLKDGSLTQVTDSDLGPVLSMIWVDGYFMTTDGASLVVTELNDPTSVDPLKYGSSEADPDPVVGLIELRGEVYAINRHTIESFVNRGGTGFPFARQRGAQIPKGCVGSAAFTLFAETFAFCGSGRQEAPAVYLAGAGQAIRISPNDLDAALGALPETDLAAIWLEARNGGGQIELFVHLPTETWVYNYTASQRLDFPVWYRLASGVGLDAAYRPRGYVYLDGQWWAGAVDGPEIGRFGVDPRVFGDAPAIRFDTPLVYNDGAGAIMHSLELVTLSGRADLGEAPTLFMSATIDGRTWSDERAAGLGTQGQRNKRVVWRRCGRLRSWQGRRFRGIADAPAAFLRLEAQVEALS